MVTNYSNQQLIDNFGRKWQKNKIKTHPKPS